METVKEYPAPEDKLYKWMREVKDGDTLFLEASVDREHWFRLAEFYENYKDTGQPMIFTYPFPP